MKMKSEQLCIRYSQLVTYVHNYEHMYALNIIHLRYISRCLLIEYKHPRLKSSMKEFEDLNDLTEKLSSSVGFLIGLGKKFLDVITNDLDNYILPKLHEHLGDKILHRVCVGYGILIWFVKQVTTFIINISIINLYLEYYIMYSLSRKVQWSI